MQKTNGHQRKRAARRIPGIVLLGVLAALLPLLALAWHVATIAAATPASIAPHAVGPRAYPPATQRAALPHHRIYSVTRQSGGYALYSADTSGTTVFVAQLPDHFGSEQTDVVQTLALSPDQHWLALDGMHDHGDFTWLVSTTTDALRTVPDDANGNFLHWMPDGEHFLFRPFLPTRPSGTDWNPGLWIVDAASGTHVNLTLPGNLPATDLIDAAPAPDGTRIILSVTAGLGQGSSTWMASPDGLSIQPLFQSVADVGLFAWSADGQHIAYETIADSTVPFRPAGLWVLNTSNATAQQIAQADGGHGFAPAWSPDGTRLAFVTRLNATDAHADIAAGALQSAVQTVSLADGQLSTVASPAQTDQPRNIDPTWQADGTLDFTAMPASNNPGAALAPAAFWHATSLTGSVHLALLRPSAGLTAATALVP